MVLKKKNFFKMPTVDFQIFGSVAKGNVTSFYFRPYDNDVLH